MRKHKFLLGLMLYGLVWIPCACRQSDPKSDLPPATQRGANTFGCYINGQPWTPKGPVPFMSTTKYISYDPGYLQGTLDIRVTRVIRADTTGVREVEAMSLFSANCKSVGTYPFAKGSDQALIFLRQNNGDFDVYDGADADTAVSGSFTLTRFDMQAGIISGTFHFKLEKPGYPTIEATDGRFDFKL